MEQLDSTVRGLPIFRHFNENEISKKVDDFTSGQKSLYWFIKLGVMLGVGYAVWTYVIPPVMIKLGQIAGALLPVILVGLVLLFWGRITDGLRMITKAVHESFIKADPFGSLAKSKDMMVQNLQQVRTSIGTLTKLKNDAEINASENENNATTIQNKILRLNEKAKTLKSQLDEMVKKDGLAVKGSDDYVNMNSDLYKILSESQRIVFVLTQSKDFVVKYGTRAAILKKTIQQLKMQDTVIGVKIEDFQTTIDILKNDYDFAEGARKATDAAKSAISFTESWEVKYAINVVNSTIANDIAITAGNIKDINALTTNYSVDSDELYSNLDKLSLSISAGTDVVPEAKKYANPEYQLTSEDKLKSNGFENIFS